MSILIRQLYLHSIFICSIWAQMIGNAPLKSDRERDQFDYCEQLYFFAANSKNPVDKEFGYKKAIQKLGDYIQIYPDNLHTEKAIYYLAESYYHTGAIHESKKLFFSLIQRYKLGAYVSMSYNRLGYDDYHNKRYLQAAEHFKLSADTSLEKRAQYSARYKVASCYFLAGAHEKAISVYKDIEKRLDAPYVYRENSRLKLGKIYLDKGKYEEAYSMFKALNDKASSSENIRVEANLQLGFLALKQKDYENALGYFHSVLASSLGKFKPTAQAGKIECLYELGKYQEILTILKTHNIIGLPAAEAIKFTLAGRSAYKLERYHEAITHLARAERQVPLSLQAFKAGYYRLLCFYEIEGSNLVTQVDAFLEIYENKYPQNPITHKARLIKAATLSKEEKYIDASTSFNKINPNLIDESNRANLLYEHAWNLSKSGDHNGAVRVLSQFLDTYENDPRFIEARAMRGKSYFALSDFQSALMDFDYLIKNHPKNDLSAFAWQNSARIYKEENNIPEMIQRFKSLYEFFPDLKKSTLANAQYWVGWGNFQIKKYNIAITHLENSASIDPDNYDDKSRLLILFCAYEMKDKELLEKTLKKVEEMGNKKSIPITVYRWLAVQCYNKGEIKSAEHYLTIGSTPMEPLETPKAYWKLLGTTRVKIGKYRSALSAIENFLGVTKNPLWRSEALLDRAKAHLALKNLNLAIESAQEGLRYQPKGQVNAELRMVLGDIYFKREDYASASAHYVVVAQLYEKIEKEVRTSALYNAYKSLRKKGDHKEAEHYLKLLNKEFPDYLKEIISQ